MARAGAIAVAVLKGAHIRSCARRSSHAGYRLCRVSRLPSGALWCRGIQCVSCSAQTAFAEWRTSNR